MKNFYSCRHVLLLLLCLGGPPAAADPLTEGNALWHSGKLPEALAAYQLAAPQNAEAALNAAVLLETLGWPDEAVGLLDRSPFRDDERLVLLKSWMKLLSGQTSEARDGFIKLAARRIPDATLGLGWAQLRLGNYEDAITPLTQFAAGRPMYALPYYLQALAYEGQGDVSRAVIAISTTVAKDAFFSEARFIQAKLLERNGQRDEAWRSYAKLRQFNANHPAIDDGIWRLAPHFAARAAQILPPHTITTPTAIQPSARQKNLIRVGIGTRSDGSPPGTKEWHFKPSGSFRVIDPTTGRPLLISSKPGIWSLRWRGPRSRGAELLTPEGRHAMSFRRVIRLVQDDAETHTFIVNSLMYRQGSAWSGMTDKELRGVLEFRVDDRKRRVVLINELPVEEYVYGVLAAEVPGQWPLEALKTQAVISRTLVLYRQRFYRPHTAHKYQLCDGEHCQVYQGVSAETPRSREAVDLTEGKAVYWRGQPAHTVFHSNCGGHTQSGLEVGWGDVPYWAAVDENPQGAHMQSPWEFRETMRSEPPAYCRGSEYVWPAEYRWIRIISPDDIARKIRGKAKIGPILGIMPLRRSAAGNVLSLKIRGEKGNFIVQKEHLIRGYLGMSALRATRFHVETLRRGGVPEAFVIYGGGWGHGVGLCQNGAAGRAAAGITYDKILATYYPGTQLKEY